MYDENGQDTNQEKDTRLHELLMASIRAMQNTDVY